MTHSLHGLVDVVEEDFEARAKIVEARFPVGRFDESVLRAAAVACETDLALAAEFRKCVKLVPAKLELLIRPH